MLKLIKKAQLIVITALAILLFAPQAFALHTTNQPNGHFGQPHQSVATGVFTVIVETTGKVDRVNFKLTKAGSPTELITQLNQSSKVASYDGKANYFKLDWDSTSVPNGDYFFFADIECDDCTPNGFTDFAVHYDGKNHLEIKVDNPAIPPPVTTPEDNPDNCTAKLNKALKRTTSINQKLQKSLTYIDNFSQQTVLFYERTNLDIASYESDTKAISEARKAAASSLLVLQSKMTLTCETSLKEQISNYLSATKSVKEDLEVYKDSVINLIVKVIGENQ